MKLCYSFWTMDLNLDEGVNVCSQIADRIFPEIKLGQKLYGFLLKGFEGCIFNSGLTEDTDIFQAAGSHETFYKDREPHDNMIR